MSKILIAEKISDGVFKLAKEHNCTKICALRGDLELFDKYPNFKNVSYPHLNIEGQWRGWDLAEQAVVKLKKSIPNLFYAANYNLQNAVVKSIWWGLYNEKGQIVRLSEQLLENGHELFVHTSHRLPSEIEKSVTKIPNDSSFIQRARTKILASGISFGLGYDIRSQFSKMPRNSFDEKVLKGKIIFFPTSIKQVLFFEDVIKELGANNTVACFGLIDLVDTPHDIMKALEERNIQWVKCVDDKSIRRLTTFLNMSWQLQAIVMNKRYNFGIREKYLISQAILSSLHEIYFLENLCKRLSPAAFITTAFENESIADLLVQVAHKYDARVINTMNGAKSATPQNHATRFDAWAIWSESQKRLLIEKGKVPKGQLRITGHLMADKAAEYIYKGTYDELLNQWPQKKILAVFSQPKVMTGNYRERFIKSIRSFIEHNSDYIAVIKPHPRESSEEVKQWTAEHDRITVLEHDSRQATKQLYDLLIIAELSVVIYSTVAYESLFFKTPVISLNFTGIEGLLPVVTNDNAWVKEVTESGKLDEAVKDLLATEKDVGQLEELVGKTDGENARRLAYYILN